MLADFFGLPLTRALVEAPFDVADAGHLNGLADAEGLVARFERRLEDAREVAEGAADLIRRVRNDLVEIPAASERAAIVESLLSSERNLGDSLCRLLQRAKRNEEEATKKAPHLLPLVQRMTLLMEEEFQLYMEAARDVRWELLALEADAEPPADGPVLSTPAALGDFIQSLRFTP